MVRIGLVGASLTMAKKEIALWFEMMEQPSGFDIWSASGSNFTLAILLSSKKACMFSIGWTAYCYLVVLLWCSGGWEGKSHSATQPGFSALARSSTTGRSYSCLEPSLSIITVNHFLYLFSSQLHLELAWGRRQLTFKMQLFLQATALSNLSE